MTKESMQECDHPADARTVRSETKHGRTVRIEVCSRCGREVVHPEDAMRMLSERGREGEPVLDAQDVALGLLGVHPERPIFNRIVMMKEAFLFEKELARELMMNVRNLGFVPYDYGPYSRDLDDALRSLESSGLIHIEKEAQGQKEVIGLTERGKEAAARLLASLDREHVAKIGRKRKAWDQLGYYGLLQKIYEEYPSFKSRSKIADKMRPLRRWV